MDHQEEIPSGVPEDSSVRLEERLAKVLPTSPDSGRLGVKLRRRGDALVIVAIDMPWELLRPPSPLADAVAGMMWACLAAYHQLGGGEILRAGVEDQDGKIQGYVLLHPDARLELFDHADLLLAEWRPEPPAGPEWPA